MLLDEIALAGEPALCKAAAAVVDEARTRYAVERLALALQGSLLARHAPATVVDVFRGRLGSA